MASIVFANKNPQTIKKVVAAPPPNAANVVKETPRVLKTIPGPIQSPVNIQKETPKPVEEVKQVTVEEKPAEAPKPVRQAPVKMVRETLKPAVQEKKEDPKPDPVPEKKPDPPKEVTRKSIQPTPPQSTGKTFALNESGMKMLIEAIVAELSKQFIRRDEVAEVVTKALQKMVMEDVRPNKEKKEPTKVESPKPTPKEEPKPVETNDSDSDDDWGIMSIIEKKFSKK